MTDSRSPSAGPGAQGAQVRGELDALPDQRIAQLPRSVEPGDELWSKISQGISETRQQSREQSRVQSRVQSREGVWVAALSGIAAALTCFAIYFGPGASVSAPGSPTPSAFAVVPGFETTGLDGAELMRVRNNLHASLSLALDELAPETRATVVENLERIDAARAEIDQALRNDPGNGLLAQMMFASYTHEIRLLNEFTLMASSAPQRTQL